MRMIMQLINWMVDEVNSGSMDKAKRVHKVLNKYRRKAR